MIESGSNEPSEELLRTGTYHPRRGPLAKVIALLILILLVLIPCLLFVLSLVMRVPPPDRSTPPDTTPVETAPPR